MNITEDFDIGPYIAVREQYPTVFIVELKVWSHNKGEHVVDHVLDVCSTLEGARESAQRHAEFMRHPVVEE